MAGAKEKYKDIDKRIEAYFDECDSLNICEKRIVKPYTLSGLIAAMGITRGEFEKLSANKRYSKLINASRSRVEAFIEENALTGGLSSNAASNSLKYNFGWGDKAKDDKESECFEGAKTITISLEGEALRLAR